MNVFLFSSLAIVALVLSGCSNSTPCGVQMINEAAGISSMQKLVAKVDKKLDLSNKVELLDPPDDGLTVLTMIDANLTRLPNGQQSTNGKFKYEVRVPSKVVRSTCVGELDDCANQIAEAVLKACGKQ